jgi:hypothetical protein
MLASLDGHLPAFYRASAELVALSPAERETALAHLPLSAAASRVCPIKGRRGPRIPGE